MCVRVMIEKARKRTPTHRCEGAGARVRCDDGLLPSGRVYAGLPATHRSRQQAGEIVIWLVPNLVRYLSCVKPCRAHHMRTSERHWSCLAAASDTPAGWGRAAWLGVWARPVAAFSLSRRHESELLVISLA